MNIKINHATQKTQRQTHGPTGLCELFLCDLLVSDRLKEALPQGPLNYVLSLEGDDWFLPEKVASLADTFVNNRLFNNRSAEIAGKGVPASGYGSGKYE